jgi:hypothetical protein
VSRVGIGAIVQARAANLEGDAAYAQPPPEEREDPEENRKRMALYRHAVETYAAASPDGSSLRNLSWHELPVGHLGAIEPDELFTKVASVAYSTLSRRAEYKQYVSSLNRNVIPAMAAAPGSVSVPATYTRLADAAGADHCGVEVVLDSILCAVAEAAGDPDGNGISSGSDGNSPQRDGETAAAAGVHRFHDAASIRTIGLASTSRDAALASGRRVVAASVGAMYAKPVPGPLSVRAKAELHRFLSTSSLPPTEIESAWRVLQFEKLLQVSTPFAREGCNTS